MNFANRLLTPWESVISQLPTGCDRGVTSPLQNEPQTRSSFRLLTSVQIERNVFPTSNYIHSCTETCRISFGFLHARVLSEHGLRAKTCWHFIGPTCVRVPSTAARKGDGRSRGGCAVSFYNKNTLSVRKRPEGLSRSKC